MTTQFRTHENGGVCCDSPDPKNRCAKCQAHLAALTDAAPDVYAAGLAELRAASAPPESFEDGFKAERLRAFAAEYRAIAEADQRANEASARLGVPVSELRFASDDGDAIPAAPDPYAAGLEKLRSGR
jgi:hypothetical protein